ncbi:hypothetical protein ebA2101 [Aromatoleum aromaticum EbN1]|uniref:Uncharacterized protein n=1 Tax=Aromatoleum aromaticum (strain DSM 19018 / LMG 30748 / EbN1) TaxID=76114 RepID=Q5P5X7_AROAE|nr:hypothetical protein ebA2101 [Aromatoleum aromaticum EbN1]
MRLSATQTPPAWGGCRKQCMVILNPYSAASMTRWIRGRRKGHDSTGQCDDAHSGTGARGRGRRRARAGGAQQGRLPRGLFVRVRLVAGRSRRAHPRDAGRQPEGVHGLPSAGERTKDRDRRRVRLLRNRHGAVGVAQFPRAPRSGPPTRFYPRFYPYPCNASFMSNEIHWRPA